jgi:hypothetical protein
MIHYVTQTMDNEYRTLNLEKGNTDDIIFKNYRFFAIIPIFILLLVRTTA